MRKMNNVKNIWKRNKSVYYTAVVFVVAILLSIVSYKLILGCFLGKCFFDSCRASFVGEKVNAFILALTAIFIFIYTLDTHRLVGITKKQRGDDIRKKVYEQIAEIYLDFINNGNALINSLRDYKQDLGYNNSLNETQKQFSTEFAEANLKIDNQKIFKAKLLKNQKQLIENCDKLLFQFFNKIDVWEAVLYKVKKQSDDLNTESSKILKELYDYSDKLSISDDKNYDDKDNLLKVKNLLIFLNKFSNLFCECHDVILADTEFAYVKDKNKQIFKNVIEKQISQ